MGLFSFLRDMCLFDWLFDRHHKEQGNDEPPASSGPASSYTHYNIDQRSGSSSFNNYGYDDLDDQLDDFDNDFDDDF